jgi:outer membrane protein assembly factor BamB
MVFLSPITMAVEPHCPPRMVWLAGQVPVAVRGRARVWFALPALGLLCWGVARGGDWPQYRGPNHDGVSSEAIRTNWSEQNPQVLWRVPLNAGLSSFAVSGGRAYTQVLRAVDGVDQEFCVALDAGTGQELWAVPMGKAVYDGGVGDGDGPRSTPSVDGDRVYVLSSYLLLACLDANTGQPVWTNDLTKTFGSSVIAWQNAASPLIDGDLVLLNCKAAGNSLLGFHKADGGVAWQGQSDYMTQATPVLATILGVRQAIFFAQSGLVSIDPASGRVLWRYPVTYNGTSVAASPVVAGDLVYCSRAYPTAAGALAVQVTASGTNLQAKPVWSKPNQLMNHWCTPVQVGGYLFGHYGQGSLTFKCVEMSTGTEKWSRAGFGYGSAIAVGGNILALSDTGDLVLVAPDPSAYTEIDRFTALSGKCWNVVAISDGRIYARSTTEGVCLDVSVPHPLQIASSSLTDGEVGVAYGAQLQAEGGVQPYRWSLAAGSPPLAPGLMLSEEGLLSGIPTAGGTYSFDVTVTDTTDTSATRSLSLAVKIPQVTIDIPRQDAATIARDGFRFELTSDSPGTYVIDWSSDLATWTQLATVTYTSGAMEILDTETIHASARYYRIHR